MHRTKKNRFYDHGFLSLETSFCNRFFVSPSHHAYLDVTKFVGCPKIDNEMSSVASRVLFCNFASFDPINLISRALEPLIFFQQKIIRSVAYSET